MPAPKPKKDEKPQFERFIEAAKRSEASETDEKLAATIRKIAKSSKSARPKSNND